MQSSPIRDKVEELIKELLSATQVRRNYGPLHKLTKEAIEKLYDKLSQILLLQAEITIGIIGNEIAFEREPYYETSKNMENFILHLKELKIEKITFVSGVTQNELSGLIAITILTPEILEKEGGIKSAALKLGLRSIVFSKLYGGDPGKTAQGKDIHFQAKENIDEGIELLAQLAEDMDSDQPLDIKSAYFFINKIIANLLQNKESLLILTSIKSHDEYTFLHSLNVAILTLAQAEALGVKQEYLTEIGVAALLHDAGKLILSGDIIRKKDKLSPEDLEKIRLHPVDGAKVLLDSPEVYPLGAIVAFEHHLRYDTQGYPARAFAGKPNFTSMMVAIADIYDALRSKRAYHEEMAPEKTFDEMTKMSGTHLHPELVENFFKIVGVYPPGTLVELDNQAVGLVVKESILDVRRPQVEILYNNRGEKEKNPYIINLLEKDKASGNYKVSIVKSILLTEKHQLPDKYR